MLGEEATCIDRSARCVELASGRRLAYGHLVLATGARQRPLVAPGIDLEGVLVLRDLTDARALRERLGVGAAHRRRGRRLHRAGDRRDSDEPWRRSDDRRSRPRPLGRAVSPATSAFFLEAHQAFGARILLGVGVVALHGQDGRGDGSRTIGRRYFAGRSRDHRHRRVAGGWAGAPSRGWPATMALSSTNISKRPIR